MLRLIARELKNHAPFTALGTVTGIIIMAIIVFGKVPAETSHIVFYSLHPLHIVASAIDRGLYCLPPEDRESATMVECYTRSGRFEDSLK